MAHVVRRVMVHEKVLTWHEQNAEQEKKRDFEAGMDNELAATEYIYVDSD